MTPCRRKLPLGLLAVLASYSGAMVEGNDRYGTVLSGREKQSEHSSVSARSRAASDSHETLVFLDNVADQ